MTREQVKGLEDMELFEGEDYLSEEITINGKKVLLVYSFNASNQLIKAGYLLREIHSNNTLYINDYEDLKQYFIEKLGTPSETNEVWLGTLYRDFKYDLGMGIATGEHVQYTKCSDENSDIELIIWGDNYKVYVRMEHKSKIYN